MILLHFIFVNSNHAVAKQLRKTTLGKPITKEAPASREDGTLEHAQATVKCLSAKRLDEGHSQERAGYNKQAQSRATECTRETRRCRDQI